jgi:hypothetical protein
MARERTCGAPKAECVETVTAHAEDVFDREPRLTAAE